MDTRKSRPASQILITVVTPLVFLGLSMSAFAQPVIEEITVTAQKIEQSMQDVPIAVTALQGDDIEATGATSIEQIQQLVPSLTFRKGTTAANSALFLRGVGTISFSRAVEPSVSTVIDGVVMSRSGQSFGDLYDIERIEVLRGPQGTLFGKNASAGVVNIVTRGGADEFEGQVSVGLYQDREYKTKLSVAGPLSDSYSARLTAAAGTFDGNITNINNGNNTQVNGYDRWGARLVIDGDPTDTVSFRLAVDSSSWDDDCCTEVTGVSRGALRDAELGFDNTLGDETRTVNHNLISKTVGETWGVSLKLDADIGSHTLTAITAFRDWDSTEVREGDFLPRALVENFELHDLGITGAKQTSFEARLVSPQDQALTYQTGVYYFTSENTQSFTREDITCATSTLGPDPVTGATPCNSADFANTAFPTSTSITEANMDNVGIFGQATYAITDEFSLTAGIRWTQDDVDYEHTRPPGIDLVTGLPAAGPGVRSDGAGGLVASGGNGTNTSVGSTDNDNISGKLVAQYDISDDVTSYFSYTRGYKGPAFNIFYNHIRPNNAVAIDEETSDALELGFKTHLFDSRLQLNVALYSVEYDGFQANNFVDLGGTIITNLTNAGTIETQGAEIDFKAALTENWELSGGIAINDATVKRFNPDPTTNAPDARNGTRLPLAPETSFSLVSTSTHPIDGLGLPLDAHLRIAYFYQDDMFSSLGESGPLDSYGLLDASIGFSDKDDKYRLTFLARNLNDESYVNLNTGNGVRLHIPRDADRYFGVLFRADF